MGFLYNHDSFYPSQPFSETLSSSSPQRNNNNRQCQRRHRSRGNNNNKKGLSRKKTNSYKHKVKQLTVQNKHFLRSLGFKLKHNY